MKARLPKEYTQSRGDMMREIQQMQQEMAQKQDELLAKEYTAKAGGGVVEATVKGDHTLVGLKIAPDVVDPEDIDMLTDLVMAAVNAAGEQLKEDYENGMSKYTGLMNGLGLGM